MLCLDLAVVKLIRKIPGVTLTSRALKKYFMKPTPLGVKLVIQEFENVNNEFSIHGLKAPIHHAYPCGGHNDVVKDIASKYRQTLRLTTNTINKPPYNYLHLEAVSLDRDMPPDHVATTLYKLSKATEGMVIFFTHKITPEPGIWDITPDIFISTLESSISYGFDVLSLSKALSSDSKHRVVFTFDDGNESDYSVAYKIMSERGLSGVSYIITSHVGKEGKLSWYQIHEMISNEWEFGCHTHTHPHLAKLSFTKP